MGSEIVALKTGDCLIQVAFRTFWYAGSLLSACEPMTLSLDRIHVKLLVTGTYFYTVDSRYLEIQGTLWNTSRCPYLDISDLQNWGKIIRTTTFNKYIVYIIWNCTPEVRDILKILWKRGGAISPLFHNLFSSVVRFSCLGRDQTFTSR